MKNKVIIVSSIILGSLMLILGITYAALTYTKTSSNQELIVGDIWMKYEETNQIVLNDAMPTNIDNYVGYVVNPVIKNQEVEEVNVLTRCVYIFLGWYFDNGTTPESFCRGTGTKYGRTFQEELNKNNFGSEQLNHFQNNDIISLESDGSYKINSVMQTQEIEETNEFTKCVYQFGYGLDEGSTPESFCKGEGTFDGGVTLEEYIEDWSSDEEYFLEYGGQDLIDEGMIIKRVTKESKYRLNQEMTEDELNKCVTILRDEWYEGIENEETWESYCNGIGTRYGQTFQYDLDNNYFSLYSLKYLEENNIINKISHELPYFEFKISGKNTYTKEDIWYEVLLNHGDNHDKKTTRIRDDLLRFTLVEIKDGKETIVINNKKYDDITNKRIWVNTIPKNTNEDISITYRLYMWIDESTIIGNNQEDYTLEEWEEVYASIKVNITGDFNEKILAYEDKYNVTDASCFGVAETYVNKTLSGELLNRCVNYLSSQGFEDKFDETYTLEDYCQGITSDSSGHYDNFSNDLMYDRFTEEQINWFLENDIIVRGINITRYDETCGSDVVIPTEFNGLPVLSIGSDGSYGPFWACEITSVVIPDTVISINSNSFFGNYIKNVIIPNSVTRIGGAAFASSGLVNLEIPDSVVWIGRDAFSNNRLTKVTFGSGIKYIGADAFFIDNYDNPNDPYDVLSNPNLKSITFKDKTCEEIKNIPDSSTNYGFYYPWTSHNQVSIYGTNGEQCEVIVAG